MLKALFGRKKRFEDEVIVSAVVGQTSALINDLNNSMDMRFKELSAQVRELELGINQLETKLLTKDLKDKQAYGLLHYKLHEAKNEKLNDEINTLETMLQKRVSAKDQ
jgi:hypothetical protein